MLLISSSWRLLLLLDLILLLLFLLINFVISRFLVRLLENLRQWVIKREYIVRNLGHFSSSSRFSRRIDHVSEVKRRPVPISLITWDVSAICVETEWCNPLRVDVHILVILPTPALVMQEEQWLPALRLDLQLDDRLAPDVLCV